MTETSKTNTMTPGTSVESKNNDKSCLVPILCCHFKRLFTKDKSKKSTVSVGEKSM